VAETNVDLKDYSLAILYGADGKLTRHAQIFHYGKQIGVISKFELKLDASKVLPEATFVFCEGLTADMLEGASEALREGLKRAVDMARASVPGAQVDEPSTRPLKPM